MKTLPRERPHFHLPFFILHFAFCISLLGLIGKVLMRDEDLIPVREPRPTWLDRLYLPRVLSGLWTTFRHLFHRRQTIRYPEQRRQAYVPRYRGLHRLNRDAAGRVKCVACFMCPTICPAKCIHVVGAPAPWPDREKYPIRFDIDELRCIYCGMCEEVCPVDAIELTPVFETVALSRAEMIFDKEKLLAVFDMTKDLKPPKNPKIVGYSIDNPTFQLEAGPGAVPQTPPPVEPGSQNQPGQESEGTN
jgi:NADH-quinone oxidoreductase subunit I